MSNLDKQQNSVEESKALDTSNFSRDRSMVSPPMIKIVSIEEEKTKEMNESMVPIMTQNSNPRSILSPLDKDVTMSDSYLGVPKREQKR